MAITDKPHTHIARTRQRIGKKFIRELEIGSGYIDEEVSLRCGPPFRDATG